MSEREQKLEWYDALLATHPEKPERKGKNMMYTSMNGHMFTYLSKENEFGIRMSKEDKAAYEEIYKTGPFIQYDSVMQGYVCVTDELFAKTEELAPWLVKSFDYIASLPPKPTKKKKK